MKILFFMFGFVIWKFSSYDEHFQIIMMNIISNIELINIGPGKIYTGTAYSVKLQFSKVSTDKNFWFKFTYKHN